MINWPVLITRHSCVSRRAAHARAKEMCRHSHKQHDDQQAKSRQCSLWRLQLSSSLLPILRQQKVKVTTLIITLASSIRILLQQKSSAWHYTHASTKALKMFWE